MSVLERQIRAVSDCQSATGLELFRELLELLPKDTDKIGIVIAALDDTQRDWPEHITRADRERFAREFIESMLDTASEKAVGNS